MNVVSRAELSRITGTTRANITYIVRSGKLPSVDGNIDLDDPEVKAYIEERKNSVKASGKNGTGRPIRNARVKNPGRPPVVRSVDEEEEFTEDQRDKIKAMMAGMNGAKNDEEQAQFDALAKKLKEAELQIKSIKIAKDRIFYDELAKKVIVYEAAVRSFNILATSIKQTFGLFDQQHGDEIYDAVISGKSRMEVMEIIRKFVESSLKDVQKSTEAAIEKLRE